MNEETCHVDAPPPLDEIVNPSKWADRVIAQRIALRIRDNRPDELWVYGGRLVRLDHATGRRDVVSKPLLKVYCNDAVHLIDEHYDRGSGHTVRNTIPVGARYMDPMMAAPLEHGFRELRGVRQCPFLAPSGRIVCTPGYDDETGIWLQWHGEPIAPAAYNLERARELFLDLLSDFPLRTAADIQHALGLLLLTMMRPAIDGPTPFHLVSSTGKGAGKTLLASLPGLLLYGHEAPTMGLDEWGAEARRQLTAALAQAPEMLNIDNVKTGSTLGGAHLHHYLTARGDVPLRPVGQAQVVVPIRCIWLATGNNIEVDDEQSRRTVPIFLERKPGYDRRDFRHPDLAGWVVSHRTEILSALGWIIESWIAAGRPDHQRRPLASFAEWSRAVGGCVAHFMTQMGIEDDWLNPDHRPRPAAPEWDELASVWPQRDEAPAWCSSRQALELIQQYDLTHFEEELASTSTRGQSTKLGRMFATASRIGVEGHSDLEVLTRKGPRTREYLVRRCGDEGAPPEPAVEEVPAEVDVDVETLSEAWQDELTAMQARGVHVDPERWDNAVHDYRAEFVTGEPDREVAEDRARSLGAYASAVSVQARCGDHRVRAGWRPDGTWTTRITASGPPLQAITKDGDLRAAVCAPPAHRLIVADWSHSHLRIAAGRAGDEQLCRDLAHGRDPHQRLGDELAPQLDEATRRALGKRLNMAALNLCSPGRIRQMLADEGVEVSTEEADAYLTAWRRRYPRLWLWLQKHSSRTSWRTPLLHRDVAVPNDARGAYPSRVIAGILQSVEGDAMRYLLARTREELEERYGARLVMIVHDEAIWEVHEAAAADAARAAGRLMRRALSTVAGDAPVEADVELAGNWA